MIAQSAPVSAADTGQTAQQNAETSSAATDAFGLSFDSLLKIILTQLTYQDPLKPMDNFEFVSQLAQFSQIQQSQTMNDRLETLVSAQATSQATSLLGTQVDIPAGATTLTGTVTAVTFDNGSPRITIKTADNRTISNLAIASVTQVRKGN
ncbi:flagellar hook capping FlgD N-terminal domain-containing protein [Sphingomonas sp. NIBR02145]|uniref:flagellar hook assembly protein FlgD n=1 Tax=Sphingomonas sp. NIBR02145 TaxID=3014784 RepID=UPI0022B4BD25|nr:flagellar hook capping FlgD N-terminal domain-containing protein [Sphingomonas sp. NIBR02145]WHU04998.1 flagellar hook capping FlgD N-terminal domain-containing protein [Sphingomonas sp. NIBR02145]